MKILFKHLDWLYSKVGIACGIVFMFETIFVFSAVSHLAIWIGNLLK